LLRARYVELSGTRKHDRSDVAEEWRRSTTPLIRISNGIGGRDHLEGFDTREGREVTGCDIWIRDLGGESKGNDRNDALTTATANGLE